MKHKKVKFKTVDGFDIRGVHTISEGSSVILWLHGITVNKDEFLNLFKDGAEFLGKHGVDSLRIDFRGHGESDGKSKDFNISGQTIDVDAAISYLRSFYKSPEVGINIVGCSFGAPPAISAAIDYPSIVKSVVLIAPVLSYRKTFLEPKTDWASSLFNPKTIATLYESNKIYFDDFAFDMRFYKEMQLIEPEELIKNVKQKITIIHGMDDSMVPFEVSKNVSAEIDKLSLIAIKNMDHGFTDVDDEEGTSQKSLENKQFIYDAIKNCFK